jgi:N-acetylneuraminic acid mutarotase
MFGKQWLQPAFGGPTPCPRHSHGMHKVDRNNIILFGGWTRGFSNGEIKDQYYNDIYMLNMDTNTWSKPSVRGKVPPPRASFASNVIGRKLYLFGGGRIWDEGPVFNDTYSYDIGTVHIIPYYTLDIVI